MIQGPAPVVGQLAAAGNHEHVEIAKYSDAAAVETQFPDDFGQRPKRSLEYADQARVFPRCRGSFRRGC